MENLEIYNKLKNVPIDYQKKIGGGRLSGMTDIKPQWRIQKMTEIFGVCGIGWKFEIIDIKYSEKDEKKQQCCFVKINLYIKVDNKWSDAIPGIGGSSFIALEKNGLYLSDECEKMALTDALSVAMKMIGVGADVYMGHGSKYYPPVVSDQTQQQPQDVIPSKPAITHKLMEKMKERINKGEKGIILKAEQSFILTQEQRNELVELYKLQTNG